ncbi:MAG: alpha/beta fold hydrolase [Saprospiraceae bacterium]|nr:alpha/beta fold hydrolase [Saprospiraceae bacterium]
MPVVNSPKLIPPLLQFNGQMQTLVPGIFRNPGLPPYQRERLTLSDGDFVDLDWVKADSDKLIILSHGLEGNSFRHYITGAANFFAAQGWNVLAWNCRSCSGEINKMPKLYHHGEIKDIGEVIDHAIKKENFEQIWLMGFSMGGNISLNYLSKTGNEIPEEIKGAVVCSSPLNMEHSVKQLETRAGRIYKKRFFKMLGEKLKAKAEQFPDWIDLSKLEEVKEWQDFDRFFSGPMNGFEDEFDFYRNTSPVYSLEKLKHPVLVVNALNDPILAKDCYPKEMAYGLDLFHLMTPLQGGHVGFSQRRKRTSWFEETALDFIRTFV